MEEYRIIKALSGFYYVQTEDGVVECRARGRFRRQDQSPLVGDFVRIEGLDGIDELIGRHRLNERFAHAVAHFDEHVALVFVIDELPNGQTVIGRERLEHIRNVGRVKCL